MEEGLPIVTPVDDVGEPPVACVGGVLLLIIIPRIVTLTLV